FARLCDFEAGRTSLRSLFWLVPLFAVWTNVHGGVLGGMGTLGLTVCGWVVLSRLRIADCGLRIEESAIRNPQSAALATLVVALAAMLPEIRWVRWLGQRGMETFRLRPGEAEGPVAGLDWKPMLLPVLLVLIALVLQGTGCAVPVLGRGWAQVKAEESPVEL